MVYLCGMIAGFVAAFAFGYPAALAWRERGFNFESLALGALALPCVVFCLTCMDKLIGLFVPDRRRGFPVHPLDPPDKGQGKPG